MQLVSLPVSPFAARVRIAIYAKDLPIDIVPPPAGWPDNRRFHDVSPTGRVPVLIDDRATLWESAVLLEFLEERFPDAVTLLPSDVYRRASARLVVRHVDEYLMPPMVALAQPADEAASRRAVERLVEGLEIVGGLLQGGLYAVEDELSMADCALAPALFAVQVTGERLGIALTEAVPAVAAYICSVVRDPHVGRVLAEMDEGLRHLARG